jgi:hypothetical protein
MRFPGTKRSPADHLTDAYHDHFGAHRRERQFLSTSAFFTTFAVTRAITHAIRAGKDRSTILVATVVPTFTT